MRPASIQQRKYIGELIAICKQRGVEVPADMLENTVDEDLSIEDAAEIIDALRMKLGRLKI